MTGPEHYREAERLTKESEDHDDTYGEWLVATAQIHATLAQVAATVSAAAHPNQSQVDHLGEWFRVIA